MENKRRLSSISTAKLEEPLEQTSTDSTVLVRSLYPSNMYVFGKVTGQKYHFPWAGAEVKVDSKDVEDMLAQRSSISCCGGGSTRNSLFELVIGG